MLYDKLFAIALIAHCCQGQSEQIFCNVTYSGGPSGPGVDCVFPFKFYGRVFDACTNAADGHKRPWCPTKLREDGTYSLTFPHWGYCHPECPFLDSDGKTQEGTTPKPGLRLDTPVIVSTTPAPAIVYKPTTRTPPTTTTQDPLNAILSNPVTQSGTWLPKAEEGICGFSVKVGYIYGGDTAARGDYPYIALLGYRGTGGRRRDYKCAGTLINRRYIVTAAHCHSDGVRGNEILEVLLGEHELGQDPDCDGCRGVQRLLPEEIVLHGGYNGSHGNGQHDIALVRLATPAVTILEDLETLVLPVCLDFSLTAESVQDSLEVAGWGKTTNDPISQVKDYNELGVAKRTLQRLRVPLVERYRCQTYWSGLTDHQICAGGELGKDSCQGDSGGPLIGSKSETHFLIGIVSAGTRNCGDGRAGLYTRVSSYKDWILSNIRH